MKPLISLSRLAALAAALALCACGSSSPVANPSASSGGGGSSSSSSGGSSSGGSTTSLDCNGSSVTHKNAYFGDMHVHTLYSIDAYFFNGLNGPREAYRFAQGQQESERQSRKSKLRK